MVEVFGSVDGQAYAKLGEAADPGGDAAVVRLTAAFAPVRTRYLKVLVHNRVIPAGFDGAGQGAWLFVDEIEVE